MPAQGPSTEKAILTLEGPRGRHPVQRVGGSPVDGRDFQGTVGRARDVWSRKEEVRVGRKEQDCALKALSWATQALDAAREVALAWPSDEGLTGQRFWLNIKNLTKMAKSGSELTQTGGV